MSLVLKYACEYIHNVPSNLGTVKRKNAQVRKKMSPDETKQDRLAFGERLKEWRQRKGLTRPQVLAMLGAGAPSESTLRNIEGGHQGTGRALKAALVRLMETGKPSKDIPTVRSANVAEEDADYSPGRPPLSPAEIARVLAVASDQDVVAAANAVAAATGQPYSRALALVVAEKFRVS